MSLGAPINGIWKQTSKSDVTVKEFKLGDPENTEARYKLDWPPGTKVSDARSNTVLVAGKDAAGDPKVAAVRSDMETIATALDTFEVDMGTYPSTAQGLQSLMKRPGTSPRWHGPYSKALPIDPWGHPYQYLSPGVHNRRGLYDLWSAGPDGRDGTADDITNWP
jgi:general secretion pathway protein G